MKLKFTLELLFPFPTSSFPLRNACSDTLWQLTQHRSTTSPKPKDVQSWHFVTLPLSNADFFHQVL